MNEVVDPLIDGLRRIQIQGLILGLPRTGESRDDEKNADLQCAAKAILHGETLLRGMRAAEQC
jgi:hypothetical protein